MSVSGTYRPPNAPKRSVAVGAMVMSCAGMYGIPECAHARVVLDPRCRLHTGGDVYHIGPQQANRFRDILRSETAREYQLRCTFPSQLTQLIAKLEPRESHPAP